MDTPGNAYGQDRTGVEDIHNDEGDLVGKLLWVNDGHGTMGEISAAEVAKHITNQYSLPGIVTAIQHLLEQKDHEAIREIIGRVYKNTAEHMAKVLRNDYDGGTTCSHALVVEAGPNKQYYVISSNMGDSPVMVIDPETGQVVGTNGVHTWDNLHEYRIYDSHCQAKGVPTAPAVYNRFNCGNGNLPGPSGDLQPIPIFSRNQQTGTIEVDDTNLEYITRVMGGMGAVGGIQSEARMVLADIHTGKAVEPLPGHGHTNWGSTVLLEDRTGGAQCTRSFADWREQRIASTIGDIPTVNVMAISSGAVVLVMSDGAADVIGYLHKFGQKVRELVNQMKERSHAHALSRPHSHKYAGSSTPDQAPLKELGVSAKSIVRGLADWVLEVGKSTPNYGLHRENGHPKWDDVTIAGATLIGKPVVGGSFGENGSSKDLTSSKELGGCYSSMQAREEPGCVKVHETMLHSRCPNGHCGFDLRAQTALSTLDIIMQVT
jgi:hypothetical protein